MPCKVVKLRMEHEKTAIPRGGKGRRSYLHIREHTGATLSVAIGTTLS